MQDRKKMTIFAANFKHIDYDCNCIIYNKHISVRFHLRKING